MLTLARYLNQSIMIGDDIIVRFSDLDISRQQIKLTIEAPQHIKIYRDEVYERIQKEKLEEQG